MDEPERLGEEIGRIAALNEPVRRSLYFLIAGLGREVGRDEAARSLRISRALAAFHLDKLVEEGLLEVVYRRISGREGPGAGRPAKLYRRSSRQIAITLPQRRYELAARLLARAVTQAGSAAAARTLAGLARELGEEIGREARLKAGARAGRPRRLEAALALLTEYGYEPVSGPGGVILLRNCPFDAIARESRDLVCGMNLALMEGLVRGLEVEGVSARLEPRPDHCCVVIVPEPGERKGGPRKGRKAV